MSGEQHAATSLCGVWRLRSAEVRCKGEKVVYPWGSTPDGYLFYTNNGQMAVLLAHAQRTPGASADLWAGSEEELARAARTFIAYAGTYQVCGQTIVHQVEISLYSNWVGSEQIRFIEDITPEKLVLRTPLMSIAHTEGIGYLFWEKQA
ncbi:MAG TPA: lipocalin-like domain-containing protein [Ktedonosporobacter sp.]|nr:lipocalin-like domain-containing protein [Ktedonosporobacter sp.]